MKHILEAKTERSSVKAAIQEAGFKLNKDLTTSSGEDLLYAILDDESMSVSYFNSISSEKTAKYRYNRIASARTVPIIALRIAKKISIRVDLVTLSIMRIFIGYNKDDDNWDDLFSEKFMFGRNLEPLKLRSETIINRNESFDNLFKDADLIPKDHNVAIVTLFYDRVMIKPDATTSVGAWPKAMSIRSISIKDEEELLGCHSFDLAHGLKSEDISGMVAKHLAERGKLSLIIPGNNVKFVVIRGKKTSTCVQYSNFLDAIDIPEKLFNTTLDKFGIKEEQTIAMTLDSTPNMLSKHRLGATPAFYALKLENILNLKAFHVNVCNGEVGEYENIIKKKSR